MLSILVLGRLGDEAAADVRALYHCLADTDRRFALASRQIAGYSWRCGFSAGQRLPDSDSGLVVSRHVAPPRQLRVGHPDADARRHLHLRWWRCPLFRPPPSGTDTAANSRRRRAGWRVSREFHHDPHRPQVTSSSLSCASPAPAVVWRGGSRVPRRLSGIGSLHRAARHRLRRRSRMAGTATEPVRPPHDPGPRTRIAHLLDQPRPPHLIR